MLFEWRRNRHHPELLVERRLLRARVAPEQRAAATARLGDRASNELAADAAPLRLWLDRQLAKLGGPAARALCWQEEGEDSDQPGLAASAGGLEGTEVQRM